MFLRITRFRTKRNNQKLIHSAGNVIQQECDNPFGVLIERDELINVSFGIVPAD